MTPFDRLAGLAAILVAAGALLYAAIFVYIVEGSPDQWVVELWYSLLIGGGMLTVLVLVGVYERLRPAGGGLALVALLLGVLGAFGGIVHGGQLLNATLQDASADPLASADPMGVFRYATAGVALAVVGYIVLMAGGLPRAIGSLAAFGGFLLVLIYAGRLYDFITPSEKVSLIPPVLYGIVVHPLLYVWLGFTMLRGAQDTRQPS
jgi:hypothetical protein